MKRPCIFGFAFLPQKKSNIEDLTDQWPKTKDQRSERSQSSMLTAKWRCGRHGTWVDLPDFRLFKNLDLLFPGFPFFPAIKITNFETHRLLRGRVGQKTEEDGRKRLWGSPFFMAPLNSPVHLARALNGVWEKKRKKQVVQKYWNIWNYMSLSADDSLLFRNCRNIKLFKLLKNIN